MYHVLDRVRVGRHEVARVPLRLRTRLHLPLLLLEVPDVALQLRGGLGRQLRSHLVLAARLPLVLVAALLAGHVACLGVGLLAGGGLVAVGLEEGGAHCELGRLGAFLLVREDFLVGDDLLVGDGFYIFFALGGFLGVGELLLDGLVAVDVVFAALGRVELRVVALLHPAVAPPAPHPRLAPALLDRLDLQPEAPRLALLGRVLVVAGVAAVVLDVVGVGAVAAVVAAWEGAYSRV